MGLIFHPRTRVLFHSCTLLLIQFLSPHSPKVSAKTFDFYYFVQEWPGSECNTHWKCCIPLSGAPASDFHIHGLWPNNNDGSWPEYCYPHQPFDFSQVADVEDELEKEWASLQCPSNDGHKFWAHEWERHGTCAFHLNEHDYFSSALSIKRRTDLLGVLASDGILPNGGDYDSDKVLESIEKAAGAIAEIRCNKNSKGEDQLKEVLICVDKVDASTVIDCPTSHHNGCASKIVFPHFSVGISNI